MQAHLWRCENVILQYEHTNRNENSSKFEVSKRTKIKENFIDTLTDEQVKKIRGGYKNKFNRWLGINRRLSNTKRGKLCSILKWIKMIKISNLNNIFYDRNTVFIVYCDRGSKSMMICPKLAARGFQVKTVVGGIHQYHGKYLVYHTDFYKDF